MQKLKGFLHKFEIRGGKDQASATFLPLGRKRSLKFD